MNTPSSAALQKRAEPQTGLRNQVRELEFWRRHCEERTRRSNPYFVRDGMDCFASARNDFKLCSPTSKSLNSLSSPVCKNIFLLACPKSNP
jgi:ribosomal protein S12 methylthiotransferase accessory factor YcaO